MKQSNNHWDILLTILFCFRCEKEGSIYSSFSEFYVQYYKVMQNNQLAKPTKASFVDVGFRLKQTLHILYLRSFSFHFAW